MGRLFLELLEGKVFCCKTCNSHLSKKDELISKEFRSRTGAAWLFNSVSNVVPGPPEERRMTTGVHLVSDIFCVGCRANVGWFYHEAYEVAQKYKEGKYILERSKMGESEYLVDMDSDDSDY